MKKYKRWNGKRKAEVAIALLKGEPLEEMSRATGQPSAFEQQSVDRQPRGGGGRTHPPLQGRQYLPRGPTIDSAACPVDRPKKIRSLDQVFCRKLEKQRLVRLADERPSEDGVIVEFVTDFGPEPEAVVS